MTALEDVECLNTLPYYCNARDSDGFIWRDNSSLGGISTHRLNPSIVIVPTIIMAEVAEKAESNGIAPPQLDLPV